VRAETCGLVVVVAVLSAAAWPALADAPEAEKASDDEPQLITGTLLEETPQERKDKYWYLILGVANVWPRLDESESEINRDINGLFGNVFPRWHNPTTFKDWRDDLMLWDIHIGLGRSLSDHWSLFTTVGAIRGTARTKNDYWTLGFPLEVYTKFERKVWFIAAGADYYPWGKASLEDATKGRNALTRRLYAARPYLEAT